MNAANGRSNEFYGLLDRAKSIAIPVLPAHQETDLQLFSELFKEFCVGESGYIFTGK